MTEPRPPWSRRRRRLLLWLGAGAVVGGVGALVLPAEFGVTAAYLGALEQLTAVNRALLLEVQAAGAEAYRLRARTQRWGSASRRAAALQRGPVPLDGVAAGLPGR